MVSNRSYVTPDDLTVLPLIMLHLRLVCQRYGRAWKRIRDRYVANHPLCEMCLKNISNANLHLMFDKIVIEETDEGLNLDLRLKSPFISKKKEPLLEKYMIVDNEVLSVGA